MKNGKPKSRRGRKRIILDPAVVHLRLEKSLLLKIKKKAKNGRQSINQALTGIILEGV